MSEFFTAEDYFLLTPAVELVLFGCGILLIDFLVEARHRAMIAMAALIGLGFTSYSLVRIQNLMTATHRTGWSGLNRSIELDHFSIFFMLVCVAATFIAILISI